MSKIYKYFPNDVLEIVFQKDGLCGLKCSFPKDYNDPFELFLSIDLTVTPDVLAFYNDVVQDIPQLPTTCFSNSPTVTPMWAHYADNQTGFVLEFDTDKLRQFSDDVMLENVSYRNKPKKGLSSTLYHAAGTKKPRHSYFLTRAVFHSAYFTKTKEWSYEKECRLVATKELIEIASGIQLLFVPLEVLSSLVVGPNFPQQKIELSQGIAKAKGLDWYQLRIGKSSRIPFMENQDGEPSIFFGNKITLADRHCKNCREPISDSESLCPWCKITQLDKLQAARTNPFRILDAFGQLEDYIRGADEIGKKYRS